MTNEPLSAGNAIDGVTAAKLYELLARTEVVDCILRYARGFDRNDAELMRSSFHPDGVFSIGDTSWTVEELIAYCEAQTPTRPICQHFLTNHRVEIDGDTAHAETYWLEGIVTPVDADVTAFAESYWPDGDPHAGGPAVTVFAGRYVDRLTRRDGEWRIEVRWSLPEWTIVGRGNLEQWIAAGGDARGPRRDRTDPSYERPLARPGGLVS